MTYNRVIPRDLFNEAKLLKCLGKLYIASERHAPGHVTVTLNDGPSTNGFDVTQDQSDGSFYANNVIVHVNGEWVHVSTPLNSREELPLYAQWNDMVISVFNIPVFNDDGTLTREFLQIGEYAP